MNKDIINKVSPDMVKDVEKTICPFCKCVVDVGCFSDPLSKKEYLISGLCQKCQDKVFK